MADDRHIGVDEPELDDAALEALALAHATAPPARLRERVLAAARAERDRSAHAGLARWRIVGAVAATVALALAGLLVRERARTGAQADELAALARSNAALTARLDDQEHAVAALRGSLGAQAQVLAALAGPHTVTAALAPTAAGGAGSGRVVVDPASGETAVVLAGLEPAPAGHVYELWAIRGSRPPEPAGLLAAEAGGPIAGRGAPLAQPAEVTAFAVSVEPSGGSAAPTGAVVLAGPVAG